MEELKLEFEEVDFDEELAKKNLDENGDLFTGEIDENDGFGVDRDQEPDDEQEVK